MTPITQSKFSKLSNLIFLTFTTFIISFIWINNYISNIKLSLISSIIISLFFFISYIVFKNYQNKIYIKNKNSKEYLEHLKNQLLFSSNSEIIKILQIAFNLSNNLLYIDNNHYFDDNNHTDIFLMFNKENLSYEDYIYIYKNKTQNNIKIFCIAPIINYPEIENTSIEVYDISKINTILNNNNLYFTNTIKLKKSPKLKLKDVLCIILNKTKSKGYFLFGLLILSTSIFTPYYIYYTIIGSILLLISIYSRFNQRFN